MNNLFQKKIIIVGVVLLLAVIFYFEKNKTVFRYGDVYYRFAKECAKDESSCHLAKQLDLYQQAIKHDATHSQSYYEMSRIYDQFQDRDRAKQALIQATQHNESLSEANFLLGSYYFDDNELNKALDSFQRTLKHEPNYQDVHYYMARIYESQGNLPAAHKMYIRGRNHTQFKGETFLRIGMLYYQFGDQRGAHYHLVTDLHDLGMPELANQLKQYIEKDIYPPYLEKKHPKIL